MMIGRRQDEPRLDVWFVATYLNTFPRRLFRFATSTKRHYLFLGKSGHLTDSGLRYIIRNVGNEAGIELHPHQLRHTMVILAFEKGAPTAIVSKLIGHRSIRTTVDIYGVFELSRLKQQHERYSPVAQAADSLHEAFVEEADEHILE